MLFTSPEWVKAETAYRQERIKRQFRAPLRRERAAQAEKPEPRHARPALRPTRAA